MNVTSTSPWTLAKIPTIPAEVGVTPLAQFASTRVPLIKSLGNVTSIAEFQKAVQGANGFVRRIDLCPQIGPDQSGQLTIVPYKELPKYVEAGDVVSFVTDSASQCWSGFNLVEMIKQRGWHAEIVVPKGGNLVLHGPWGGSGGAVMCAPIEDVTKHPYYNECRSIWYLHIFRFSPPSQADNARFSSLIKGLEAWSTIFPRTNWPGDMKFNPLLFSNIPSLSKIGDSLIQMVTPPPTMFCIEWVNAAFCLACCYPLTSKFLSGRGMLSAFTKNFPQVGLLDDVLEPFDTLPWAAYLPSYIIESFASIYFGKDLNEAAIEAMPGEASIPSPVIMPIVPLLEMRRKSNPSNFNVSYVCTAVADEYCIPK